MKNQEEIIQEMQLLEQNIQNLILQKQAFEMELNETESAIKEIKGSGEDVFKIVGQIMIKTEKSKINEELSNKEKILNLRVQSIEKQEFSLTERLETLRKDIMQSMEKKKNV